MVVFGQNAFTPQKADVLIIPGAKTGSFSLHDRCVKAIELYNKGYAKKIITTGAKGVDESLEEARDAAEYMIIKGVNKDDIFLEINSHNTW